MRITKFRAQRSDTTEWVYFTLGDLVCGDATTIGKGFDWGNWCEWTGLLDKNGKEIYEGDIVVEQGYIWFDGGKPNYRGTVEWIYSQWQVVAHCVNPEKRGISDGVNEEINPGGIEEGGKTDWEVIGDIYRNPELLRTKD